MIIDNMDYITEVLLNAAAEIAGIAWRMKHKPKNSDNYEASMRKDIVTLDYSVKRASSVLERLKDIAVEQENVKWPKTIVWDVVGGGGALIASSGGGGGSYSQTTIFTTTAPLPGLPSAVGKTPEGFRPVKPEYAAPESEEPRRMQPGWTVEYMAPDVVEDAAYGLTDWAMNAYK